MEYEVKNKIDLIGKISLVCLSVTCIIVFILIFLFQIDNDLYYKYTNIIHILLFIAFVFAFINGFIIIWVLIKYTSDDINSDDYVVIKKDYLNYLKKRIKK